MSQMKARRDFFDMTAKQLQGFRMPSFGIEDATQANARILEGVLKGQRAVLMGYVKALEEMLSALEETAPKKRRPEKVEIT